MPDEDIFDLSDDDEVPAPQAEAQRKREAADIRKRLKAAEALEKEVEELRTFRQEREKVDRQNAVSTVFKDVGLNPKWVGFYNAEDFSPEAVKQWAIEQEFLQPVEGEPAPEPAVAGFTPTVIAESASVGSKVYSQDEFMELLKTDPNKATQVHQAGRVKLESSPSTHFYGRDR